MSKTLKKALALILALTMICALAACGTEPVVEEKKEETKTEEKKEETKQEETKVEEKKEEKEPDLRLAAEAIGEYFDVEGWTDESAEIYDKVLGEYYDYYSKALECDNVSERTALMAIAEAKIMEAGVMLPLTTRGGNYAISRVAPYTINSTLWGNDSDRFHQAIVATEPIIPADRDEMKAKWAEVKGTGTYEQWAKDFLTGKGYTLKNTYTLGYSSDPVTWDALATSMAADSEAIVNTYDGLYEYDIENIAQPALAESYTVSDDGTVYTFKLRQGVTWVDSQGRKVADVTADDFVAGMQHMMDAMGGLEYLVQPIIVGADAYINGETRDFTTVGVKAVDEYTLEYTLVAPCSYFTTMLAYNVFAPMSRAYYTSQGGKFGAEYNPDDPSYAYGIDSDHIAYCGPYLVTNATEKNTIVFKANPSYWNKDGINLESIIWVFNDGSDATKAYNDMKAGVVDGCGLNTAAVEAAKADGWFDKYSYTSATDATSYMGFLNINRKAFANFNDATVAVSEKTINDAERTAAAMQNVHFRRAFCTSLDRASYNAQSVGESLKLNSLRNSYTPGTFVTLAEDVTVDIAGKATTYKAGTFYGQIMQDQIDADGVQIKAWDPTADGGIGSSDGYDGWYNPTYAVAEMELAVKELADEGVTVSADEPILIDLPYYSSSEVYTNRANVFKQSVETVLGGKIILNLIPCEAVADWYYAGYYPEYGYEMNADIMDVSGWGPDYGDPQTYLDTMLPDYAGYMVKSMGMF